MFGCDLTELKKRKLVVTNMRVIFDALGPDLEERSGWWQAKLSDEYLFVKIPQGTVIIDCVRYLAPFISDMSFFGLAGSIDEQFPLGSVVSVSSAIAVDDELNMSPLLSCGGGGVSVCTVPAFCIENDRLFSSVSQKLFDMESYHLIKHSLAVNIPCRISLIISDNPLKDPFYLDSEEKFMIVKKAVPTLLEVLEDDS